MNSFIAFLVTIAGIVIFGPGLFAVIMVGGLILFTICLLIDTVKQDYEHTKYQKSLEQQDIEIKTRKLAWDKSHPKPDATHFALTKYNR